MTEDDLKTIENELSIRLPEEYKRIVLNYPFPSYPDARDEELVDDSASIIESNVCYRKLGYFGTEWKHDYFTFGGDGFGNIWFLDVSKEKSPVLYANHETGEFGTIDSASLQEWIEDKEIEFEEYAEERAEKEARLKERQLHKKWWQFWI